MISDANLGLKVLLIGCSLVAGYVVYILLSAPAMAELHNQYQAEYEEYQTAQSDEESLRKDPDIRYEEQNDGTRVYYVLRDGEYKEHRRFGLLSEPQMGRLSAFLMTIYIGAGVFAAFCYPVAAAYLVRSSEELAKWAYQERYEPWSEDVRLMLGCIWPVSLVGSVLVFLFLGIINRVFVE